MSAKGKKLRTFYHSCRKDFENGDFRPCQITEDNFVSVSESETIQHDRAVVHNEYVLRDGFQPLTGGETQNDRWLHEWFGSDRVREMGYVKLKIRTPYDLQNEVIRAEDLLTKHACGSKFAELFSHHGSLDDQCRMQHYFQPRVAVQRELLKVLLLPRMQMWDAFVAMHIRTGFADFQNAWVRRTMPHVSPMKLAEMERQHPCGTEDIVHGIGRVFQQCSPDYSDQICSHWWELPEHLQKRVDRGGEKRRGPIVEDGVERCYECKWCDDTVPPEDRPDLVYSSGRIGTGALAAAVTCGSRLAAHIAVDEVGTRMAEEASARERQEGVGGASSPGDLGSREYRRGLAGDTARDLWGLYVLGDSPAVVKALSHDARLAGHVVHQADEDVVGVTMSQVVCNEEQVCTGAAASQGVGGEEDGGEFEYDAPDVGPQRADVTLIPSRSRSLSRRGGRSRGSKGGGGRRGGADGNGNGGDRSGSEKTTTTTTAAAAAAADEDDEHEHDDDDDDDQKGGVGHNRGWMRAVVDMYMASLADGDVQLPGSSFMKSAAASLSITNRASNALRFGGEVVLDQMVTPEGETKERPAGFDKKPENYVLLSASHCKFENKSNYSI